MGKKRWLLIGLMNMSFAAPQAQAQVSRPPEFAPIMEATPIIANSSDGTQASRHASIARLVGEARALFRDGNSKLALAKVEEIRKLDPDNPAMALLVDIARTRIAEKQSNHEEKKKPQEMQSKLRERVSVHFSETPLQDVMGTLEALGKIVIVPDLAALRVAGIGLDRKIILKADNISLATVLQLSLHQAGLVYTIRDDIIVVTTAAGAEPIVRRVYAVADLIVPIENGTTKKKATEEMASDLITLIQSTIAGNSWAANGGRGKIDFYPLGLALVVDQTADGHEAIAVLLAQLRKMYETQVTVEIRILQASHSMMDYFDKSDVRLQSVRGVGANQGTPRKMAFLSQAQVDEFLNAARGDCRTNLMQAPKITVLNGAVANIAVTDKMFFVTRWARLRAGNQLVMVPQNDPHEIGIKFNVTPVVAADQRSIRLNFGASVTSLESTINIPTVPMSIPLLGAGGGTSSTVTTYLQQPKFNILSLQTTVAVPDGETVMYSGLQTTVDGHRTDYYLPSLTDDRDLDRVMFTVAAGLLPGGAITAPILAAYSRPTTAVTHETRNVVILVTPRIIAAEAEGKDTGHGGK